MKKKLLSIILAIVMVLGILPISAFASELSETLTCTEWGSYSVTGTHFELNTTYMDNNGACLDRDVRIGSFNGEIITKIEGHCSFEPDSMVDLEPSSGSWEKVDNDKFEITGINSTVVTFNAEDGTSQYDIITIYYTEASSQRTVTLTNFEYDNSNTISYTVGEGGTYELVAPDKTGYRFNRFELSDEIPYVDMDNETGILSIGEEVDCDFSVTAVYDEEVEVPENASVITGTITAADFGYTMVIPTSTVLTEAKHENVLLGTTAAADGDGIVSIKDIKHPTDKVNVYYTVDISNGDLTDGTNTIAATYKYKQGGDFTAIDGTTKVTVYANKTVTNSLVNVTADDTQWKAAPTGTYNATVVFNFEKEEAEEKITVGSLLSTAIVAIPDGWTTTSTWTGENTNHDPFSLCTNSAYGEALYLYNGAGWSKLTSFGDEVEKIESSDNYAFIRPTHEVIFVMTDGHLTAIIVRMETLGSDVEFTPKVG